MKIADIIEQSEEPLEVVMVTDNLDEMQKHFGIYSSDDTD